MSQHALLIGIQTYRHLPDLAGPFNDVVELGRILLLDFDFPDDQVVPLIESEATPEITRDRVVEAFEALIERVDTDDTVVIAYSGHGSRLIGDGMTIETLVPADSGRPDAEGDGPENRDILDREIDDWIRRLNEKTPHLTLIFDSCHSGSVTREPFAADGRAVPPDRLDRRPDALVTDPVTRSIGGGSAFGRWAHRRSALVLAACRAEETAKEHNPAGEPHGAFTYCLVRALKAHGATTWRSIFQTVAARVTSLYASQHPQIEGDWDTRVFGTDRERPARHLNVTEVAGDRIVLAGGAAHGISVGSRWSLHAATAMAPRDEPARIVTIESVEPGRSVGRLDADKPRIRVGQRAFPIDLPSSSPVLPIAVDGDDEAAESLRRRLDASALSSASDATADATILVRHLAPRTALSDDTPCRHLGPLDEPRWATIGRDGRLVTRTRSVDDDGLDALLDDLEAVARYRRLLAIEPPAHSPLDGRVRLRVLRLGDGEPVEIEPVLGDGLRRVTWGERLDIEVIHDHDTPIWVSLLHFGCDHAIDRLLPDRRHEHFTPGGQRLEPGERLSLVRDHLTGIADLGGHPELVLQRPDGFPWDAEAAAEGSAGDTAVVHLRLIVTSAPLDVEIVTQEATRSLADGAHPLLALGRHADGRGTRDPGDTSGEPMAWTQLDISLSIGGGERGSAEGSLADRAADEPTVGQLVTDRAHHAVIFGIDAYRHGIEPLQTAVHDARCVAETLEAQGYSIDLRVDGDAHRDGIVEALSQASELAAVDAAVVVYFAGHGVAVDDGTLRPRGSLLPADADRHDEATWLSMSDLEPILGGFRCNHLLLVLDCCFAGSFRWMGAGTRNVTPLGQPLFPSQVRRYLKGTAWHLLTSASYNERALDFLPGQGNTRDADGETVVNSPFAHHLIEGLGGQADRARVGCEADGVITVTELYQHLYDTLVPADAASWQTPGLSALKPESTGEYIFVPDPTRVDPPPDPILDEANNPWLGLKAYATQDKDRFFGRNHEITRLRAKLDAVPFLVVSGASGSGKSSLVRAGLLPPLRQPDSPWTVNALLRLHRGDLIATLEKRLGRFDLEGDDDRQVLFVDQFEELFVRHSPTDQQRFLDRLRELVESTPVRVVITIRSDFEPQLRSAHGWARHVDQGLFPIPPPSSTDLRAIIEEPARLQGLFFESAADDDGAEASSDGSIDLVDRMLGDVLSMPGALPMLSFTLSEMYLAALDRWRESEPDRTLRRADFAAAGGGVVGSIQRRARRLYEDAESRSATEARLIRWLFLRMVTQDGGRLARRRVSEQELQRTNDSENALLATILEDYKKPGLITSDDGYYEPGHDTLVTSWPLLLGWLREAGPQDLYRDLWRAARAWQRSEDHEKHKARRGRLWTEDPRLMAFAELRGWTHRQAERWIPRGIQELWREIREQSKAPLDPLSKAERLFVDASAKEFHRRRLRRRILTAVVVLGALIAGGLYLDQRSQRDMLAGWYESETRSRSRLIDSLRIARRHLGATTRLRQGQSRLAVGLATEQVEPFDSHGTRTLVEILDGGRDQPGDPERGLRRAPPYRLDHFELAADAIALAWRPDGEALATLAADGRLRIHDLSSAERRLLSAPATRDAALPGEPLGADGSIAWSPQGDHLLTTTGPNGVATIWDAEHLEPLATMGSVAEATWLPAYRSARRLLVRDGEGFDHLRRTPSAELERLGVDPARSGTRAVASRNGRRLARMTSTSLEAWDLEPRPPRLGFSLDGHFAAVDWSPEGSALIALDTAGRLTTISAHADRAGREARRRVLSTQELPAGPGGSSLVSTEPSTGSVARLLTVRDGGPLAVWNLQSDGWLDLASSIWPGRASLEERVAWAPGGRWIVRSSPQLAEIFDPSGLRIARLPVDPDVPTRAAWSPLGDRVATASGATIELWATDHRILAALARRTHGECLVADERRRFFGEGHWVADGGVETCRVCLPCLRRKEPTTWDAWRAVWRDYRQCLDQASFDPAFCRSDGIPTSTAGAISDPF